MSSSYLSSIEIYNSSRSGHGHYDLGPRLRNVFFGLTLARRQNAKPREPADAAGRGSPERMQAKDGGTGNQSASTPTSSRGSGITA